MKYCLLFLTILISQLNNCAQDSLQFLSATTGAAAYVTAYHENHLFTGTGSTFRVYDVTPGEAPPYDVRFEFRFTSIINEIEIHRENAYICSNHAGISKWDISNPLTPRMIWEWIPPSLDQACYDVSFKGDSLFVANRSRVTLLRDNGSSVTHILDFAIQTNPWVRIMGGDVKDNLYAFTVNTMWPVHSILLDGVHIYNATDLTEIAFHYEPFGDHEDVLFGQNTDLLHVLAGTQATSNFFDQRGHFYTLNVSNPAQPYAIFLDTLDVHPIFGFGQGQALNAEIRNDTVFMVTKAAEDSLISLLDPPNGNIYVYDATNNQEVRGLTIIDAGLWFFDIALQDNLLHIASEWFGIRTKDISDIYNDVFIGDTPTGGWNIMSDIHGDKMVQANEGYGLRLFDISDPSKPVLLYEHINISDGFCFGVQFSEDGNYIYGSYFIPDDGLRVFDTSLTQVGALSDFTGYESMHLWQNKIVAHGSIPTSGHQIYLADITNPTVPHLTAAKSMEVYDLAVHENGLAFVSTSDSLMVMDLKNNLQTLHTVSSSGGESFEALAVFKDTLYVYVTDKGLVRYFYDPVGHHLTEDLSIILPEGDAKLLAADSMGLYIGFQQHGLHAYDRTSLSFIDSYAGAGDFQHPELWGMQDLEVENGLIMLVEYFEQTSLLTFDNDRLTSIERTSIPEPLVAVYPNPSSTVIKIRIDANDDLMYSIGIYGLDGREVLKKDNLRTSYYEMNTSELESGFYLITVESSKGRVVKKIHLE